MAKKGFGKFIAFATIAGAAAAGVSYALRYKTFHKELEKDFREFEDGEESADAEEDGPEANPTPADRNYIALHASKDEFKLAAKDMAEATKNVLKDAGVVLTDTAHDAMSAAVDTAQIALNAVKTRRAQAGAQPEEEDSFEDEFLDDDYVDDDDLYDYAKTQGAGEETFPAEDLTDLNAAAGEAPDKAEDGKVTATIEEDTL